MQGERRASLLAFQNRRPTSCEVKIPQAGVLTPAYIIKVTFFTSQMSRTSLLVMPWLKKGLSKMNACLNFAMAKKRTNEIKPFGSMGRPTSCETKGTVLHDIVVPSGRQNIGRNVGASRAQSYACIISAEAPPDSLRSKMQQSGTPV